MRSHQALFVFAVVIGALVVGSLRADTPAQSEGSPAPIPYVTRVFYLRGIEPREAATLLRSQAQVRRLAMIPGRGAIIGRGPRDLSKPIDDNTVRSTLFDATIGRAEQHSSRHEHGRPSCPSDLHPTPRW